MRQQQRRVVVLGGLVVMALGCGGIMRTATSQALVDSFYEMERKLETLPEGYPRDRVRSVLQRGSSDAAGGRVTLVMMASIQISFENIISDGQITDSEAGVFETTYSRVLYEN